jgi:hypothetical protein
MTEQRESGPQPEDKPTVTIFTDAELARLRTGAVTTFPEGTTGTVQIFIKNPKEDPRDLLQKAASLREDEYIKLELGDVTTTEPLSGVSHKLHLVHLPGERHELVGYKVAATRSPDVDELSEDGKEVRPVAVLERLFGGVEGLVTRLEEKQINPKNMEIDNVAFLVGRRNPEKPGEHHVHFFTPVKK